MGLEASITGGMGSLVRAEARGHYRLAKDLCSGAIAAGLPRAGGAEAVGLWAGGVGGQPL